MKKKLLERFSQYIAYATTSDETSASYPSTAAQLVFGDFLVEELKKLGLTEVKKDEYGYVTATLPANTDKVLPTIGFIAHFDTAPDMPGIAKPRIINNYDGKDIMLDAETNTALTLADFPELKEYVGQTLLTTDGKTLLGADDKAGIAEIVCAMEYLMAHSEIKHGKIRVGFTPDEEIGKGVLHFDVKGFGCDFAYTMDGGDIGELEFENFNAASAKIYIKGISVHPGYAKGKMVNANLLAMELAKMLPEDETPEITEGYQGFYHLLGVQSSVEKASMHYIIRDHDRARFEERKRTIKNIVETLNEKYGEGTVTAEIKDQYYNMKEKIDPQMHVIDIVLHAMQTCGVAPKVKPIRGGTDGAQLSFKGLPCPNIFAGGVNFHGPYEFVSIQSMEKAQQVIVEICRLVAGFND